MHVTHREAIFINAKKERFAALGDLLKADDFSYYCYHDRKSGIDVTFQVLPSQPSEEERTSSDVANRRLPVDVGGVSNRQFAELYRILGDFARYTLDWGVPPSDSKVRNTVDLLLRALFGEE